MPWLCHLSQAYLRPLVTAYCAPKGNIKLWKCIKVHSNYSSTQLLWTWMMASRKMKTKTCHLIRNHLSVSKQEEIFSPQRSICDHSELVFIHRQKDYLKPTSKDGKQGSQELSYLVYRHLLTRQKIPFCLEECQRNITEAKSPIWIIQKENVSQFHILLLLQITCMQQ